MGKKLKTPADRRLIAFYEGDVETLQQFYSEVGYNFAVRELIHNHCNKLREKASRSGVIANVGPASDFDLADLGLAVPGGTGAGGADV